MNQSLAIVRASRWLARAKRNKQQCEAYLDGAFDASICKSEQAELESLFKNYLTKKEKSSKLKT